MKFSKEERIEIGQKIHESGLTNRIAAKLFGISEGSARRYLIIYEQSHGLELSSSKSRKDAVNTTLSTTSYKPVESSNDYSSMTREELVKEFMKTKIRDTIKKRICSEEN